MCSIFGWNRPVSRQDVFFILNEAHKRGRDGWGFWADGEVFRGLGTPTAEAVEKLIASRMVVGNFRATPTTEKESRVHLLQPYGGVVHNGMIANDKELGNAAIDSMVLGPLLQNVRTLEALKRALHKVTGSYAIAFCRGDLMLLAANYKPIHIQKSIFGILFASMPYMLPGESTPFPPYSVAKVSGGNITYSPLPRKQNKKVAVSCSGGLDSVTVLYFLKSHGFKVTLVHFLYGCLAEKEEVERVRKISEHGGFDLAFIEVPRGTMGGTIVEGHYHAEDTGIASAEYAHDWVSARNLVMLSLLTAFAEKNGMGYIAFGGNLEESGAYPDNEEEFGRRFNEVLPFATQNGVKIELLQPVSQLMKHEIVKLGVSLKVPYELTWSCYGNGKKHCGKCGPCFMRKMAFKRNGLKDPVFR